MGIESLISKETIIFAESIITKKALFEKAGNLLEEEGIVTHSTKFIQALEKREKETSTGIEEGFGIPHGKSKCVRRPALLFIHSGKIIDYQGLDEQPVECSFIIAVPRNANDLHLALLSSLSRKLMNKAFRGALKNAITSTQVEKILLS